MLDKIFIDTNIFVYAHLDDAKNEQEHLKHLKAKRFLENISTDSEIIISTQVCSEYYSALLKNKVDSTDIQDSLNTLMMAATDVLSINPNATMVI